MDCRLCWSAGVGRICKHGKRAFCTVRTVIITRVQVRRYGGAGAIPQRLVYTNSVLHGQVARTQQQSLLVWHTPLLRRLLRIGLQPPGEKTWLTLNLPLLVLANVETHDLINIQLSGVSLSSAPDRAAVWLRQTLLNRTVQFRLLHKKNDGIECIVHSWRPRWFRYVRSLCFYVLGPFRIDNSP